MGIFDYYLTTLARLMEISPFGRDDIGGGIGINQN